MARHNVNSTARKARQIRSQLKLIDPSNSHEQLQSPLFSKIPPEIRNQIFELAVSQHNNAVDPFEYYDKAWNFLSLDLVAEPPMKRYLDLLLTCRRIYYETRSIPMRSATHLITIEWYSKTTTWFSNLTAKNIDELNHVNLVLAVGSRQLFKLLSLPQCRPNRVTISIIRDRILAAPPRVEFLDHAKKFSEHMVDIRFPDSVINCVIEFESWAPNREVMETVSKEVEALIEERTGSDSCFMRTDGKSLVRNQTAVEIRRSWDDRPRAANTFVAKYLFTVEQ
jgi:hypothetical protein